MPAGLRPLVRVDVPLLPFGLVGIAALRAMGKSRDHDARASEQDLAPSTMPAPSFVGETLDSLVEQLAKHGHGVIMTMGKGGVGKTTVAARIAGALAGRGFPVTLTTTDPAAHVEQAALDLGVDLKTLVVTRIDPAAETKRYTDEVMANADPSLDAAGRSLLEEDLRSPCTEEVAVFRAFADTVAQGVGRFVVIDTAPTGHTLL